MARTDPRDTRDLSRQLHQAAYPGSEPAWIEERVATAEARIGRAMRARPSTAEGARRLSDGVLNHAAPRRRSTRQRIVLGAGLGAVAAVASVLGITERRWVAEAAISTIGITGLLAAAAVAITGMV
ncbi:phosphate ABC transporter substrate-binding protein, partial [Amycolatopsis mediterranei]